LRGYDVDDHVVKTKTIGHSHVLPPEMRTKEGALAVLRRLISKSGYRLRKDGYWAGGVSVSIKFIDRGGFHQSKKCFPFCDNSSFLKNIFILLKNCSWQSIPLFVSVSAIDLIKKSCTQISIFEDLEKQKAISEALDRINDQYGADTLYFASIFQSKNYAPDRIPFGRPRYDIRH
jgi:DNA polymerase-4